MHLKIQILRRDKFVLCVSGNLDAHHFPSVFFNNPACGFPKCKCNAIPARKNVFTFSGLKEELLFCY